LTVEATSFITFSFSTLAVSRRRAGDKLKVRNGDIKIKVGKKVRNCNSKI
jgi:hypothetical protein